jgi:hypothetical protein
LDIFNLYHLLSIRKIDPIICEFCIHVQDKWATLNQDPIDIVVDSEKAAKIMEYKKDEKAKGYVNIGCCLVPWLHKLL